MRKIMLVLAVFTFASLCLAQSADKKESQVNFSGKWIVNETETKTGDFASDLKGSVTEIDYQKPELRLVRRLQKNGESITTAEKIYYTDKRGETNGEEISKTTLSGNKLVTKLTPKTKGQIIFELSNDGRKLTETYKFTSRITIRMFGTEKVDEKEVEVYKIVYNRQ